jgi:hypothetical protein
MEPSLTRLVQQVESRSTNGGTWPAPRPRHSRPSPAGRPEMQTAPIDAMQLTLALAPDLVLGAGAMLILVFAALGRRATRTSAPSAS